MNGNQQNNDGQDMNEVDNEDHKEDQNAMNENNNNEDKKEDQNAMNKVINSENNEIIKDREIFVKLSDGCKKSFFKDWFQQEEIDVVELLFCYYYNRLILCAIKISIEENDDECWGPDNDDVRPFFCKMASFTLAIIEEIRIGFLDGHLNSNPKEMIFWALNSNAIQLDENGSEIEHDSEECFLHLRYNAPGGSPFFLTSNEVNEFKKNQNYEDIKQLISTDIEYEMLQVAKDAFNKEIIRFSQKLDVFFSTRNIVSAILFVFRRKISVKSENELSYFEKINPQVTQLSFKLNDFVYTQGVKLDLIDEMQSLLMLLKEKNKFDFWFKCLEFTDNKIEEETDESVELWIKDQSINENIMKINYDYFKLLLLFISDFNDHTHIGNFAFLIQLLRHSRSVENVSKSFDFANEFVEDKANKKISGFFKYIVVEENKNAND
jgi:hypothetical protein